MTFFGMLFYFILQKFVEIGGSLYVEKRFQRWQPSAILNFNDKTYRKSYMGFSKNPLLDP